jgi:group I intron endonuclease
VREGIIYLVTNTINNKKYIGQTVMTLKKRWKLHLSDAEYNRTAMTIHNAIRKYGPASFTIETIAETLEPFLDDLEIFLIKLYNTKSKWGYNSTDGGGGTRGHKRSPEAIEKTRQANIGGKASEEHREKLRVAHPGKKRSEQHCRNIGLSRQGRKFSAEDKAKMSLSAIGRRHSEETKAKMRISQQKRRSVQLT